MKRNNNRKAFTPCLRTVMLLFRKKEVTFGSQKLLLFLSKPQALYIINTAC